MDPYGPYWETLELEPGSDLDAIKRAYREQALTWHPDRFPYDPELRARCEDRMRHVNAAYSALRELADGGLPPLPEATQAWRPAQEEPEPEPASAQRPAEEPAEEPGWVERWLGAPRPRGRTSDEQRDSPAVRPPPPEWASLAHLAAALSAAALALGALFLLPNQTWTPYWQAMRLVASPALGYAAVISAARGVLEMALSLMLLALALNPLLPVPMGLEEWRVFNAVTPVLLLGMFIWTAKRGN